MKAMILAAGRGERMRPLTDKTPKPLLRVGGRSLIEHHLQALAKAGIREIVINHAYLGEQIEAALGKGHHFGLNIQYSPEPKGALNTGGGIYHALPILGVDPFLVINGDIWTDYPLSHLLQVRFDQAYLVMVANPAHHPQGDFRLKGSKLHSEESNKTTYSGVGLYHPSLFSCCNTKSFPLAPLLRQAIRNGTVGGEFYKGRWIDVGTPQRLYKLNRLLGTATK